jgi:hypothetical protein
MPALNRARLSAKIAACQHNIHNIGLTLSMLRQAKNEEWPRAWYEDATTNQYCNVWGRLVDGGYAEDIDVFACPARGSRLQRTDVGKDPDFPAWWPTGMVETGVFEDVVNAGFGYDNGRIHKNSDPARIVAADILETEWDVDSPEYGAGIDPYVPLNHDDGTANVLYVDNAVRVVEPDYVHWVWIPCPTDWPTLTRQGFMQNPRLDVGAKEGRMGYVDTRNGADVPGGDDFDDCYLIDSGTEAQVFYLLTNDEFEQYGDAQGTLLATEDASIQPCINMNHQTGWPESIRPTTPIQ